MFIELSCIFLVEWKFNLDWGKSENKQKISQNID